MYIHPTLSFVFSAVVWPVFCEHDYVGQAQKNMKRVIVNMMI